MPFPASTGLLFEISEPRTHHVECMAMANCYLRQRNHVAGLDPIDDAEDVPRDGGHDPPVLIRRHLVGPLFSDRGP